MSKHDLLKTQTCVLRVNIDCDGCKSKVKKTLQKIDDVYVTSIDMQQGKVTVTGNVDPAVLIKKLEKSGKHATVWSTEKGNSNKSKNGEFDNVNDQLKKLLQGGNGKGGGGDFKKFEHKGGKEQPKGGNGGGGDGKNLQQINFQQFLEQMKSGSKDFTMKDQKPVKVNNFQGKGDDHDFGDFSGDDEFDDEDDYSDDDEFDEEEDDEFDDEEDEDDYDDDDDDEEDDDEEELGYDDGKHHKQQKITMPIMVNDLGKDKKGSDKGKKSGNGDGKKSGGFMSMIGKAMGGNNEGKEGKGGKKGWGGEIGGKKQSGEGKNNGGSPKNGGEGKNGNKGGGGGGGGKKGGGNKIGSLKDLDVPSHKGGGGGGMGQMGQYQMGPVGHTAPMMNMNGGGSGYYQGMGPMTGNPYQQQQYMAMMMNQQRMNGGGGMYHPAMYGPPPPGYGYVPPPPVYRDNVTHMFSDENPSGCSIM